MPSPLLDKRTVGQRIATISAIADVYKLVSSPKASAMPLPGPEESGNFGVTLSQCKPSCVATSPVRVRGTRLDDHRLLDHSRW